MSVVKKVFDLVSVEPFNYLKHSDLVSLADVVSYRTCDINESLLLKGDTVLYLYVILSGGLQYGVKEIKNIFGLYEILFSQPALQNLVSTHEESRLLMLSRKHLFTLIDECPEFLVGLLGEKILS